MRLLAKSYDENEFGDSPPDYALLTRHSCDVAEACNALVNAVGRTALWNAGLGIEKLENFKLALRANGWIQDLGKASKQFQEMLRPASQDTSQGQQLVRHEMISGMLVWQDSRLRNWISKLPLPTPLLLAAIWGAMGHHRKFSIDTRPRADAPSPLIVQIANEDFKTVLNCMSKDLGLGPVPCIEANLTVGYSAQDACDLPASEIIKDLQDEFVELESEFNNDVERRLLALIKGFGIAGDVAASAVAGRQRYSYSLADYVAKEMCGGGLIVSDLTKLIQNWAWARSKYDRLKFAKGSSPPDVIPRTFQKDISRSESFLTLAQAGCGSGKSLAAYMWTREWCQKRAADKSNQTNFRLFFCLPTTGTTTEHFKDYALESGIDGNLIGLTHSRAGVDLTTMAETTAQENKEMDSDEGDTAKAALASLNAKRDKIESLELWSTPLVVTTADTVLGLMVNARRSIYSLPAIMSAVIVFDEIHSFDDQLFGSLLVFLKHFPNQPVLLMTASLSECRLRALRSVRTDLNIIPGDERLEKLARYLIDDNATESEAWDLAEQCVNEGGKVLWVRNRVEWANTTYLLAQKKFSESAVNVYHSRFRYKDRSARHREVIDNFKGAENRVMCHALLPRPALHEVRRNRGGASQAAVLVTTQVAEMSLDLSADLLITDIAPIPSLIQRMGRLNRRATPDNYQEPRHALILRLPQGTPYIEKPYGREDLERAEEWLHMLANRNCALGQRDLAEAFAAFDDLKEYELRGAEERACFFSGLWQTRPGVLRGEGHTVTVILEKDWDHWKRKNPGKSSHNPSRDWLRENEVSILYKDVVLNWERVGAVLVAPTNEVAYDFDETTKKGTGARWRKD
jgi:CRISPR-associated endonuclease/helicase Cas3